MSRRTRLHGAALLAALVAACQDQPTQPAALRLDPAVVRGGAVDALGLDRASLLFAGAGDLADRFDADVVGRAINPADYVCSSNTAVRGWITNEVDRSLAVEQARFLAAYDLRAYEVPMYEAIYFQSPSASDYFGVDGAHTKGVRKTERQLKGFWDIPSAQIAVMPMHGNVLTDTLRTYNVYRLLGQSDVDAKSSARAVRDAIVGSQTMADGNHPAFTFNGVSFATPSGRPSDRIVLGDGFLSVFEALGFGDVAPAAILAHEYAHQVQFANGYRLADATAPEAMRFSELGADAMAAYFLTHARGGTMNRKRVEQFLQVFYQIGDCLYAEASHHGTPNQRLAAATFGFDVADQARQQGMILSAADFQARFVAQYPTLVAPDAH